MWRARVAIGYFSTFDEEAAGVQILLTNDDGIFAPGLAAMERRLRELGDVCVVAPATEQSGVSHSITFLTPLIVKDVYQGDKRWGWAVEGSPADCVKIAVSELCPRVPDLVVSGINGGLNAGINVLYSGTVAAAIEGAFFGITSVAVSLEFDEHAQYDRAARLAGHVIERIIEHPDSKGQLYNLNIPTEAVEEPFTEEKLSSDQSLVQTVPMDVTLYGDEYERRTDPWGRDYYWATGRPPAVVGTETDLSALARGHVTLTPLCYDMTNRASLEKMKDWNLHPDPATLIESESSRVNTCDQSGEGNHVPVVRSMRRMQGTSPESE
ncbi:MAG: 5'/3'-nucleotidase SurE [Pirellulales bacterium]|nr:5'/3'-nucleotidase SurE [Pirellulales bacterium]